MELTIFNTYVVMESQEQCDRFKKLCIDNNLPIWDDDCAFEYADKENVFGYDNEGNVFFVLPDNYHSNHTQVTEQEFINLLNKHNETSKTK